MKKILLTSEYDSDMRSYGLRLGANDYLVKPFKFSDLLNTFSRMTLV